MNKKKTIIAAIVLLLVLLVGGAIAYFTDTDSKTNTFTIGKVKITLTEPSWVAADAENLVPNQEVNKDPQVKNDSAKGSTNPAYVFVKVEVPCYTTTGENPTTSDLFTYTVNGGWTELSHTTCTSSSQKSEYVYYYGSNGTLTSLAKDATTPAVFSKVKLANIDGSETIPSDVEMPVTAYGIQTEGLGTNPSPTTVYGNFNS